MSDRARKARLVARGLAESESANILSVGEKCVGFIVKNPVKSEKPMMPFQRYSEQTTGSYHKSCLETLEQCKILAADLLQKAVCSGDKCWDCSGWVGRCLKGTINQIARSAACEEFSQKS